MNVGCLLFPMGFWLLLFLGGFWMVVVISWMLLDGCNDGRPLHVLALQKCKLSLV